MTGGLFFRLFRPVAGNETRCRWNPDRNSTDCVLRTAEGAADIGEQPAEKRASASGDLSWWPPLRSSDSLLMRVTLLTTVGRMGASATTVDVSAESLDRVDLGLEASLEEQLRLSASSSSSLMRSSSSSSPSMSSSTEKLSDGGCIMVCGVSAVGCGWI